MVNAYRIKSIGADFVPPNAIQREAMPTPTEALAPNRTEAALYLVRQNSRFPVFT